jgi:fermentation-respiration switch protein FrsA (DUF1100 family)
MQGRLNLQDMHDMWIAVEISAGIYLALVSCIFAFQRHLMYHPLKSISPPEVYGLTGVEDIMLASTDGVRLQAWVRAARKGMPTIVYFHGNASNLSDRANKFSGFIEAGFGLVALGYRGFGRSEGTPSEMGLYADARAAIVYAKSVMHVPQKKLIYFGESLGSGVAVQMAKEQAPALLMLEAAYTSVETRSAELYPFVLGVRNLVLDKYDSLSKIKDVHAPLLMVHGQRDEVIPLAHGRALLEGANEPKQIVVYPDVHHADYSNGQILVPLMDAVKKYGITR